MMGMMRPPAPLGRRLMKRLDEASRPIGQEVDDGLDATSRPIGQEVDEEA